MSTMREEFEAWAAGKGLPTKRDASGTYWSSSVEDRWEAYAAGQRVNTALLKQALEALEHCADWLPEDSSARMGAISAIDGLVAAIRARDKEQG